MKYKVNVEIDDIKITGVFINLNFGVPFISVPDTFGAKKTGDANTRDYALSEDKYDADKLNSITKPKLIYIDDEGNENDTRFKFITIIASFIEKVEAYIYYDTEERVLFMIPDPLMYENGLEVKGKTIGITTGSTLISGNDSVVYKLPEPSVADDTVATVTMNSRGLEHAGGNSNRVKISDTATIASGKNNVVEYAVLSDVLSFDSDIPYNTFVMIDIGVRKVSNLKFGTPEQFMIPIVF